jgi:hypothetical protein
MNLSAITKKYINRPFAECGCIELVVAVMAEMGHPLPDSIDGIDAVNYRDLVASDIKKAQVAMLRAFRQIGDPASTKYPAIGDLLVVMQSDCGLFPAVAVGSGMGLASFIRTGVSIFSLDKYNRPIMARRVG